MHYLQWYVIRVCKHVLICMIVGILLCSHSSQVLLEATSSMCALETGGSRDPWKESWTGKATMRQPLKTLLQLPINPEKFYNWVPGFKPPGF